MQALHHCFLINSVGYTGVKNGANKRGGEGGGGRKEGRFSGGSRVLHDKNRIRRNIVAPLNFSGDKLHSYLSLGISFFGVFRQFVVRVKSK